MIFDLPQWCFEIVSFCQKCDASRNRIILEILFFFGVLGSTPTTAATIPSGKIIVCSFWFVRINPCTAIWIVVGQKVCSANSLHFTARLEFRRAKAKKLNKSFIIYRIRYLDSIFRTFFFLFLNAFLRHW